MHFVISVFVSICLLLIVILFSEVLPFLVKAIFALGGSATTGLSIAYGIRKIAEVSSWYKKPPLLNTFCISSICVLVVVIICWIIIARKRKKAN